MLTLQVQGKTVRFELHALAGLLPESVRQYCTNIHCILMTQLQTIEPVSLLRGLYPNFRLMLTNKGQSNKVRFEMHPLAGILPEPVRKYCTNIHCILMTQPATADPISLLRGLYPNARPQELSRVASDFMGMQLSPEVLKKKMIEAMVEQVFAGRELRHKKWCEVSSALRAESHNHDNNCSHDNDISNSSHITH